MQAVDVAAQGAPSQQGVLILDLDDTLCLSNPYGGYQARSALWRPAEEPKDIWEKLFSRDAVEALRELMLATRPRVALSTSWLAIMDRQHFVEVFNRTGLGVVAESFHEHWDIPQNLGVSRRDAIARWLEAHHSTEPLLILDDPASGESLIESVWDAAGHQILCEVDRGFHAGLLPKAIQALQTPYVKPLWW